MGDRDLVKELRHRADMIESSDQKLDGFRPRNVTIMRDSAMAIERLLGETVSEPSELRLLRELESELRTAKPNKARRLTHILRELNALRGIGVPHSREPHATPRR